MSYRVAAAPPSCEWLPGGSLVKHFPCCRSHCCPLTCAALQQPPHPALLLHNIRVRRRGCGLWRRPHAVVNIMHGMSAGEVAGEPVGGHERVVEGPAGVKGGWAGDDRQLEGEHAKRRTKQGTLYSIQSGTLKGHPCESKCNLPPDANLVGQDVVEVDGQHQVPQPQRDVHLSSETGAASNKDGICLLP